MTPEVRRKTFTVTAEAYLERIRVTDFQFLTLTGRRT